MILTPAQLKSFQHGLGCAHDARVRVEYLQKVAEVYPPIKDVVEELATRLEHLKALCEAAIAADSPGIGG